MKSLLSILIIVFISCSQQKSSDDIHIVPVRKKPEIKIQTNKPPLPPPIQTYYLPSNFIIDTTGQVYFYQHQQFGVFCGTGIEWDTPPDFIGLEPKDLVQIPVIGIEDFIKLNIVTLDINDRRVAIASIKDTVSSVGLTKILRAFNDKTNKIKWTFRKATQEEAVVLAYKQKNLEYYPGEVKWDSSRIRNAPKAGSDIVY